MWPLNRSACSWPTECPKPVWCNIAVLRKVGVLIEMRPADEVICSRPGVILLLAIAFCVSMMRPAFGHHSFTAEFTAEKTATLTGTITQVWFRNPHVRFLISVANTDGEDEIWDARGSPVVWLARKGWKKNSIKVGDTVSMYGFLGRDGRKMLSIMTVTLEDGTVMVDRVPE